MNYELGIRNYGRIFAITLVAVFLLFMIHNSLFIIPAGAQIAPELMLSWKANNYAPADYQGKVLPSDGTRVDLALEVIDGGRLANISRNQIHWFVNGNFLNSGAGMKNASFNTGKGDQRVDVEVQGYRGATLEKSITIPVVSPEVVIEEGPEAFEAVLYFFNIQNLSQAKFTWSANGIQTSGAVENPNFLSLDLSNVPSGSEITLRVEVQNLLKPLEIATKSIQITKQ